MAALEHAESLHPVDLHVSFVVADEHGHLASPDEFALTAVLDHMKAKPLDVWRGHGHLRGTETERECQ